MTFIQKVAETIAAHDMLGRGDTVAAALSGGADSVALLRVLCLLRGEYEMNLAAVHVNHGLRGADADADEAFCSSLCGELGVKFLPFAVNVREIAENKRISLEEAGRFARYSVFERVSEEIGAGAVAVAHNQEDDAETVLMRLARGTGMKGLCGIPYKRGNIIRPLLDCSRAEIEAFLDEMGQSFRVDNTNLAPIYTRNKLRLCALPALAEINPAAVRAIARAAKSLAAEDSFLDGLAVSEIGGEMSVSPERAEVSVSALLSAPPALRPRIIRLGLEKAGLPSRDISAAHFDAILSALEREGGKEISLPGGLAAEKSCGVLILRKVSRRVAFELVLEPVPERELFAPEIGGFVYFSRDFQKIHKKAEKAFINEMNYDIIKNGLVVRSRRNGDRIRLHGGTRKLSDIFTDKKIPRSKRDSFPVVADLSGNIMWVAGLCAAETGGFEKIYMAIYGSEEIAEL